MKTATCIQAWIGCLASYNQGDLHGRWISFDQPLEDVWAEVNDLLKESPALNAEEFMIFDTEGFYGTVGEHTSIEEAYRMAELIEEHGEAFARFISNVGDVDEQAFEEAYHGHFSSELEYTEQFIDDIGLLHDAPETLQRYFDVEAFSRDLFLSDYYALAADDGGVFVFSNY